MTEFEALYIFNETFDSWIMLFTTFVSIVFAFLVAASISHAKLNRFLSRIIVLLYSTACFFFIIMTTIVGTRTSQLLSKYTAMTQPDVENAGEAVFPFIMVYSISLIMLLSYICSLIFFYHQRKAGRDE